MTLIEQPTMTPQTVLDAARDLAPTITARAAEVEAARRIPRDLLDQLIAAGCFRMLLPTSHGGLGADLMAMRVYEQLARADASVAWTVMIGSGSWLDLAGLPRESFDELFAPDVVILAGAFNPTGKLEPVDGGYRVSGRWGFASGCQHATWIFGNCIEGVVDGMPRLRIAVFSPDQVVIEDTWNVSGLIGTGSHHFHADDVFVPADRTVDPLADLDPCVDAPLLHIPPPAAFSMGIASVATGIAQGALDDIVALAAAKVPLLAPAPLATSALFQQELARAETAMRATRSLLYETAADAMAVVRGGSMLSLEQRARIRATAVWVTEQAAEIVDTAYRSGGGSSIYADNSLQRRFRDIHALTQHFLVKRDTLTTAGAIFTGQDVQVLVF
jgi:alkylation response protein AidB-like acyl-CoA dehydrogenase